MNTIILFLAACLMHRVAGHGRMEGKEFFSSKDIFLFFLIS